MKFLKTRNILYTVYYALYTLYDKNFLQSNGTYKYNPINNSFKLNCLNRRLQYILIVIVIVTYPL